MQLIQNGLHVSSQNRRWSPAQAREFLHLHNTLAFITLHSDLDPQRTHRETFKSNLESHRVFVQSSSQSDPHLSPLLSCVAPEGSKLRVSCIPSSTQLLPLNADIQASLFTPEGQPYLLEVKYTFKTCLGILLNQGYRRITKTQMGV